MPELERLEHRLQRSRTLLSLVRNVKLLAAVTIREQQLAARAAQKSREVLETALSVLLQQLRYRGAEPDTQAVPPARIVLGSDQGLCGSFNRQLAQTLDKESIGGPLLVVGYRMGRELERLGLVPEAVLTVPGSAAGFRNTVGQLLDRLDRWQAAGVSRVDLFLNQPDATGMQCFPRVRPLLPLDEDLRTAICETTWPGQAEPMLLGAPEDLFGTLLRQWLFLRMYDALASSMVAESGARLFTMQSAETNIEEKLETLQRLYRTERQSQIDAELLDISAGWEAVRRGS